ncbi:hypothetical protein HAX54_019409 [Datura stramonium]|uniref:Disease resistance protein n=1 Tax=Datura stramonium TaxID=4076 RepID=A0ABS8URZ6_DATST|nr:hypothetical protein [Datura stramonium]
MGAREPISSNVVIVSKREYNGAGTRGDSYRKHNFLHCGTTEFGVSPDFFQSKEWCLGDITFHNLKVLKLVDIDISRWDASEESFPGLETLVIKRCDKLKEIPLSFADIPTLKQIKLKQTTFTWREEKESFEASAMRINEAVEDIEGCGGIDLIIP